mgnify:CR=1 FL=1
MLLDYCTTEATRSLLTLVLAALSERGVDHMAKIRLQANVKEAQQREHLVDVGVTWMNRPFLNSRRSTFSLLQIRSDEIILNGLQELHGKEEKDA